MKPDRETKQAMALMAAGTLDERSRKHLERLIESDAGHRAYWNEISQIRGRLESEAQSSAEVEAPSDFHATLRQRIIGTNVSRDLSPARSNWISRLGFALGTLAVIVLLLVLFVNSLIKQPHRAVQAIAPESATQDESNTGPHTMMDYLQAVSKSEKSFDELLREEMKSSVSFRSEPVVRMGDRAVPESR